ncbi:MAG: protease inhibitor I42 family protein [Methanobacteriaceae archaeon]
MDSNKLIAIVVIVLIAAVVAIAVAEIVTINNPAQNATNNTTANNTTHNNGTNPVQKNQTHSGYKVGDTITITQSGDASTGYEWTASPGENVKLISTNTNGKTWTFKFRATAPGSSITVFKYAQSWDESTASYRSQTIYVQ